MRRTFLAITLLAIPLFGFAQEDDLLKELDDLSQNETVFELPAFTLEQKNGIQQIYDQYIKVGIHHLW